MGKIYTKKINRYDGGMTSEIRSKSANKFAMARHFDVFTYPHKLVPRFSADSKETGSDFTSLATKPFKFFFDAGISAVKYLFGLAKVSDNKACVVYWDNDLVEWVAPTNGLSGSGEVNDNVFFNYNGYAFMVSTPYIKRYKLDAGTPFADTWQTITAFFNTCQPVHFLKSNSAYFFTDNRVHTLDTADTFDDDVFLCPTGTYVAAACEYEDYLVMAINYTGFQKSAILFWNRDPTEANATYRYEMNNRDIYQMKVINGRLMVVSSDYTRVYVDRYNGAEFQTINELVGGRTTLLAVVTDYTISRENAIVQNRLLFPMDYTSNNGTNNSRLGIWALDSNGRLSLDYIVNGATSYKGICPLYGDLWIAYNTGSIVRSNISFSTDVTSDYETLMLEEPNNNKKLLSVGVSTEPLPAAGQIVLKYRLREDTTWTTIFTHTTDDSYYHEAINIESTGATLPQFREIQFKVESIGGAVITELTYTYEEVNDNPSF